MKDDKFVVENYDEDELLASKMNLMALSKLTAQTRVMQSVHISDAAYLNSMIEAINTSMWGVLAYALTVKSKENKTEASDGYKKIRKQTISLFNDFMREVKENLSD